MIRLILSIHISSRLFEFFPLDSNFVSFLCETALFAVDSMTIFQKKLNYIHRPQIISNQVMKYIICIQYSDYRVHINAGFVCRCIGCGPLSPQWLVAKSIASPDADILRCDTSWADNQSIQPRCGCRRQWHTGHVACVVLMFLWGIQNNNNKSKRFLHLRLSSTIWILVFSLVERATGRSHYPSRIDKNFRFHYSLRWTCGVSYS